MDQSTSFTRSKRAKKTFSGCWTCRERHVRCDEGRPRCSRCKKAGISCRGYGIKLVWLDPDTNERQQKIRRVIEDPTPYRAESSLMPIDVQSALDRLEQDNVSSVGPFSVLNLCSELQSGIARTQDPSQYDPQVFETSSSSSACDVDGQERAATTRHRASSMTSNSPNSVGRHLDLLPRPMEQRELIHHWVTFVSWHLVPVDGPDNPFRSVLTPMALEGLNSSAQESNGRVALFHSLCATSAYSRGQLLNDARALTLAAKHYHLALCHLRHSLASLTGADLDAQRDSIVATITMFSVMDMVTGRSSEWRTHVEGGVSLLPTVDGRIWNSDKSTSMIYQSYLAVATLCNIELPPAIAVESEGCSCYVLDTLFGLTRPILQYIIKLNSLLSRTAAGDVDSELLNQLEEETRQNSPETISLGSMADPLARQLARHHAFVFHYASRIHFERIVRRTSPVELQDLVAQAVEHFEEIERLGADMVGCTLIWPPFIVACECLRPDLQNRMLDWYKVKRRHGFLNLEISKNLAQEVWRRRNEALNDIDIRWQDVRTDLDIDIVLA